MEPAFIAATIGGAATFAVVAFLVWPRKKPESSFFIPAGFDPDSEVELLREKVRKHAGKFVYGKAEYHNAKDGRHMELYWRPRYPNWCADFNGVITHHDTLDAACDWLRRRAERHLDQFGPPTAARVIR